MQVDPEMEFSGSESSDFEDVYQAKDEGVGAAVARSEAGRVEDPEGGNLAQLRETLGTAQIIQTATGSTAQDTGLGAKLTLQEVDAQWLNRTFTKFL